MLTEDSDLTYVNAIILLLTQVFFVPQRIYALFVFYEGALG